ncbi:class III poly(R)-hydroxyalkanoic acid synthase subunit PhaC [Candidatus Thiothrix sp. Deng01]|uniref:Poly(3-hydroxyalkanoate) polymerase subunit PhaC n=1 Tax=Candidatus Thiothrix phosphatis TaxID=3112415 RepID=A0ABU6D460_9GAMM|nr:class III poly(R)-hydroxyalkanoic acid synthase subunit PhaC [Candidatus Thiothrix sp. Deng01]MEB4593597.1 class III poly(R)-hydroxyalkanoic acid synthase subunit PhaC [Candidatus Thiothrix sp. Deng01]
MPFQMRPDEILNEVKTFNEKLAQGMTNLMEVGEISSGVTPFEVVYQEDKLKLIRYIGEKEPTNKMPVLIVYALVNRPYMTDIQENRSTIKGLLDAGQDVYLVDWGYPDASDRYLTLDDYLNGYLDNCVDEIRARHGLDAINLLGICQGGVFSLCYTAMHQEKIKNLVTMVTPVDFQTPDNMLSHWVQNMDIDLLVDTLGNVPGEMLNWTFLNLKPYQLMGQKYLGMVDVMGDSQTLKNFMRMEKWIFDSPDQAGEAFREFTKNFFQQNKLLKGGLQIGGHAVDLKSITAPIFNVFAEQDHLVPPDASRVLNGATSSSDYSELSFKGGHIGIYVSGKAQKTIPPAIGAWLTERS